MSLTANNIVMGSNDTAWHKAKRTPDYFTYTEYCWTVAATGFTHFGFKFEETLRVWDAGGLK